MANKNPAIIEFDIPFQKGIRDVICSGVFEGIARESHENHVEEGPTDLELQEDLQKLGGLLNQFTEIGRELKQQQHQRLEEMQQLAVELAIAVASQLVHEQLQNGDFAVEALVKKVVHILPTESAVTVYLNPNDLKLLNSRLVDTVLFAERERTVRLARDPELQRGDCRAESADVKVHARIEDQITLLRERLLNSLEEVETERRSSAAFPFFEDYAARRDSA